MTEIEERDEAFANQRIELNQRLDAIVQIVMSEDASQTLKPKLTQEQIGEIYRLAMGLYKCTEHIIEG